MRDYILTKGDRKIITKFIETGEKLEGFYVLLHRARKQNPQQVTDDLQLLQQFLEKAKTKEAQQQT